MTAAAAEATRGYGLTGMRERAELLGGELQRQPRHPEAFASSCAARDDDSGREPIRVLLADDQRSYAKSLAMVLGLLQGIEVVVATASDGEEAVALANDHEPGRRLSWICGCPAGRRRSDPTAP